MKIRFGRQKKVKDSAVRGVGRLGWLFRLKWYVASTAQVCGLFPFITGSASPRIGVPLGRHLLTKVQVCCDNISWFRIAKLISNPSMAILALPARGKSTLVRRIMTGVRAFGVLNMVLGDVKGEYIDLIQKLGGQVIRLGRGEGYINVLDPGGVIEAAERLRAAGFSGEARKLLAQAHGRKVAMLCTLITIQRKESPTDREVSIINEAIRVLDKVHDGVPLLGDLLTVIQQAPPEVRAMVVDRGSMQRYREITEDLEASLIALVSGGAMGGCFSRETTTQMKLDRDVVFDISGIDESESDLLGALLMACWSQGFGTIDVAHALADAGLEPHRNYEVILDEIWKALRTSSGLVDRMDALTRLDRNTGVGQIQVFHTFKDTLSLPKEEDRQKAMGLIERAGIVVMGGLPPAEMPLMEPIVPMSKREKKMVTSWSSPGTWDPKTNSEGASPGRGKFLIKVGGRPGIPVEVLLTEEELPISDTNKRWNNQAFIAPEKVAA